MNHKDFFALFERRVGLSKATLTAKNKEYASGEDKLHNFKAAAALEGVTPSEALRGMLIKHWISLKDMTEGYEDGVYSEAYIDEKIGDAVNYLILLEACLKDK